MPESEKQPTIPEPPVAHLAEVRAKGMIRQAFELFTDHFKKLAEDLRAFSTKQKEVQERINDANRFTSYYSQIYQGMLAALEKTDGGRTTTERGGKLSAAVLSGDIKATAETQEIAKKPIDPHELITTDVLAALVHDKRIREDIAVAPGGSIVMARGSVCFLDGQGLDMAGTLLTAMSDSFPEDQQPIVTVLRSMIGHIALPSSVFFRADDGCLVVGCIKTTGMEEPVSTYHFRHGARWQPAVHLLGIKEAAFQQPDVPGSPMHMLGSQLAEQLGNLVFPDGAVRVTPIAIFRKLCQAPQPAA